MQYCAVCFRPILWETRLAVYRVSAMRYRASIVSTYETPLLKTDLLLPGFVGARFTGFSANSSRKTLPVVGCASDILHGETSFSEPDPLAATVCVSARFIGFTVQ